MVCGGGEVSVGRGGLRLTSGFQKWKGEAGGALYPQPLTRLIALPVISIPFLPCFKKGRREYGKCLLSSCPRVLCPQCLIYGSSPLFESSQYRESCFPHSQSGFPVPSQVSVCLPNKRAIRPSTEPRKESFKLRWV